MKKILFYSMLLILSFLFAVSCNQNNQNQAKEATTELISSENKPDYSGVYKSTSTIGGCMLTITISKENDAYKYNITGEHYDAEGIAIIEQTDATYITFDGPIGSNQPKSVSGQIEGNKILIQNYGNAMNEYHCFVECDEKFLEFTK